MKINLSVYQVGRWELELVLEMLTHLKSRSMRISPVRMSLRKEKGVGVTLVVEQVRQLKVVVSVRRDREGVRRAALTKKYFQNMNF